MDRHRPRRAGFTLVEILIVIVIIGVLMALILPAIAGAVRAAKVAQVTAEINNLATALASFRNTYDDYPPSRIIISEGGLGSLSAATLASTVPSNDTSDTDITYQQLVNRSLLYLRKFWPRCDFINPGGNLPGTFNDFNGNGVNDYTQNNVSYTILSGSECLAFFLGGLPVYSVNSSGQTIIAGMTGFSKSPVFPFTWQTFAPNRTIPNYEFNNGRLVDLDGDGYPSYLDAYTTGPTDSVGYAYFSAYRTNSYDPNDNGFDNINGGVTHANATLTTGPGPEADDQSTAHPVERGFSVSFPTYNSGGTASTYAYSTGPNPYTNGIEYPSNGPASFFNPNTFQLFSAGADRLWGLGGQYIPSAGTGGRLPLLLLHPSTGSADPANIHNEPLEIRGRESDNVTNFSGGRLD